ncbi:Uncharacterised protein [Clostridium putrefaciens]|uniref:Uncharacterized protein n=1 Tax=Clostridium putrefaciens TaxID=99675 RepID=A0A381J5L3_9CLOT|nr:Uncharacterised protein [Clostridium putrefaciens]
MKLIFKEIDRENWEECADLTALREQGKYVSLNCYYLI